jgi:DNA replication protein DnaC
MRTSEVQTITYKESFMQTITKMNELKLHGMSRSFAERRIKPDHQELSHDEFVALLIDDEYVYRQNNRQRRLLHGARLKFPSAAIENIDYQQSRGITKAKVTALQNNQWLEKFQNILISGATGVGKSYLACTFGQWACRNDFSVYYSRWPRMLGDILAAKGEGSYLKYLQKLAKVDLLIIDDFGLNSLSDTDRKDFMEIIEDRYMTGSTIIASQLPIKEWHAFIGDPTIADAVCDRLFHVAHKFELKGGSMRKKSENID